MIDLTARKVWVGYGSSARHLSEVQLGPARSRSSP